jgi:hypothetical protein
MVHGEEEVGVLGQGGNYFGMLKPMTRTYMKETGFSKILTT